MEPPESKWTPDDRIEFSLDNVFEAIAYFGDCPKKTLMYYAANADEESSESSFRSWSRGQLLAYVIERYPSWQTEQE